MQNILAPDLPKSQVQFPEVQMIYYTKLYRDSQQKNSIQAILVSFIETERSNSWGLDSIIDGARAIFYFLACTTNEE